MPPPIRYCWYGRVSERGSEWSAQESSISEQRASVDAWVQSRGGVVVQGYSDEFLTGATSDRPGLQAILADLQRTPKPWDVLIVRDLSRISRSVADGSQIFQALVDAGAGLVSITQNIDLSTPFGRGMVYILLAVAQMQREEIASYTKARQTKMARDGQWTSGRPPLGYTKRDDHTLQVDPYGAATIREIFTRYANGESTVAISRDLGMKRYSIAYMLRNRTYLGHTHFSGQEFPDTHEAIVSQELFDTVNKLLPGVAKAERPGATKHDYILGGGTLVTEEGCIMSPYSARGRGGKRYHYYCAAKTSNEPLRRVPVEAIEAAVVDCLENIRIPEEIIRGVVSGAADELAAREVDLRPQIEADSNELQQLETERDKIEELFLSGIVTKENATRWNNRMRDTSDRIGVLRARLSTLRAQRRELDVDAEVAHILSSLQHYSDILRHAKGLQRISALRALVSQVRLTGPTSAELTITVNGSTKDIKWLTFPHVVEPLYGYRDWFARVAS